MNIDGKTYVIAPEQEEGACTGCAASRKNDPHQKLCPKLTASATVCADERRIFIEASALDIAVEAAPKSAGFVNARQAAWDAYADSRAKLVGTRPAGVAQMRFDAGYERGYLDGVLAHKAKSLDMLPPSVRLEQAVARASDPQTSQDAAVRVSRMVGRIADAVMITLHARGPMTGSELAEFTGIPLNSITPRFAQLRRRGLIHAAGGTGRETKWAIGNGIEAPRASAQVPTI